jgi:hypothetical protein
MTAMRKPELFKMGLRAAALTHDNRAAFERFYLSITKAWSIDPSTGGLTGNLVHVLTDDDIDALRAELTRLEALEVA